MSPAESQAVYQTAIAQTRVDRVAQTVDEERAWQRRIEQERIFRLAHEAVRETYAQEPARVRVRQ